MFSSLIDVLFGGPSRRCRRPSVEAMLVMLIATGFFASPSLSAQNPTPLVPEPLLACRNVPRSPPAEGASGSSGGVHMDTTFTIEVAHRVWEWTERTVTRDVILGGTSPANWQACGTVGYHARSARLEVEGVRARVRLRASTARLVDLIRGRAPDSVQNVTSENP